MVFDKAIVRTAQHAGVGALFEAGGEQSVRCFIGAGKVGKGVFYLRRKGGTVGDKAVHVCQEAGKARLAHGQRSCQHAQLVSVNFRRVYAWLRPYECDFFKFGAQTVYCTGGGGVASQHYKLGSDIYQPLNAAANYGGNFVRAFVAVRAVRLVGKVDVIASAAYAHDLRQRGQAAYSRIQNAYKHTI